MQQPRSRVNELKLEIDQISKRISINPDDSIESPTKKPNFDKNREKEELQKQLKSLKLSTSQKRETFNLELQQISKKHQ